MTYLVNSPSEGRGTATRRPHPSINRMRLLREARSLCQGSFVHIIVEQSFQMVEKGKSADRGAQAQRAPWLPRWFSLHHTTKLTRRRRLAQNRHRGLERGPVQFRCASRAASPPPLAPNDASQKISCASSIASAARPVLSYEAGILRRCCRCLVQGCACSRIRVIGTMPARIE
jgi:hypothetical protein